MLDSYHCWIISGKVQDEPQCVTREHQGHFHGFLTGYPGIIKPLYISACVRCEVLLKRQFYRGIIRHNNKHSDSLVK